ncbi:ribonuclease HII [Limnobacter parvus]|uniref:Ribonuclease n=1 Tax=Limnobacter parvus TaxID=2939690 RepID=A0ABT1XI68_9BURK|nr:ribonuclease HII [Limnobacter parvus]MCR2746967.1 ribonuclease HII [Limnobacter parvus]
MAKFQEWSELQAFAAAHSLVIIGVDEAGRGPLCGPVVAGAALLDSPNPIEGLACSKTLTPKKRELLAARIQELAPAWAVAHGTVEEIDRVNILQASLLAMWRAVDAVVQQAGLKPEQCLIAVDGNKLPKWPYKAVAVVKGDTKIPAISAGSILAKVARDEWCKTHAQQYPEYEFDVHMGYPTARHMALLMQYGATQVHRKSFRPVREALEREQQGLPF